MKFNEIQWNSMKFNEIQWNSMKFNEIQWNSMKFNEIQWNFKVLDEVKQKFCPIPFNFVISHFRFHSFWKFSATFKTYLNFWNFALAIRNRWQQIKKWIMKLNTANTSDVVASHNFRRVSSAAVHFSSVETKSGPVGDVARAHLHGR